MGTDAGNLYLTNLINRYKYMKIPIKLIPQSCIDKYNPTSKVKMGMFIVKLFVECTDYPKQANLLITSSKSAYLKRTTLC